MSERNIFEMDLDKNQANWEALSPLSFIRRTASVYPTRTAVVHGDLRRNWLQTYERCVLLASALHKRGIKLGETVAVMAPNVPELLEAHFGVPMSGGVLNALNIRLDAESIAFILEHSEAKILITDTEFSPVISKALEKMAAPPLVIDISDPRGKGGQLLGECDYEAFLAQGDANYDWPRPADEWQAISLNYTSGTTGNPKGVVYHHRGAYLNSLGNVLTQALPHHPVYLWTLPMFHCNGWCFPWAVTAAGATHVTLRRVEAAGINAAIAADGVTNFCAAPTVLVALVNAPDTVAFPRRVIISTAGAPPSPTTIAQIEALGATLYHVYGLTETYGPITESAWQSPLWDRCDSPERARLKSRQGVPMITVGAGDVRVVDAASNDVPADGVTPGEIVMRGNNVMKGYYADPAATEAAFTGGWFHSGDVAVMHADGYLEITDRAKDVIISGGENISTQQVEKVLMGHHAVLEVAVVAIPSERWGEVPKAFVTLKPGHTVEPDELQRFARERLAAFKVPKTYEFGALPKTSTGKIQKYVLREREWAGKTKRVN
jgi:fatty-acyl-CoA synthase